MFINFKNKYNEIGATFIEYAAIVAVFLSIFLFFGKLLSENSKKVASESHTLMADVVPCANLGDSEYLIGSKAADREVCID